MTTGESRQPRWLYPGLALLMCATVAWGFRATYLQPLLAGTLHKNGIVHAHAAVFGAWMLLFLAQGSLVALGRADLHRRTGPLLMLFGVLVVVTGIIAGIGLPAAHVADGRMPEAQGGLVALYNLTDITVFAGFLSAAYILQHRADWHRRLVICAGVALTGAAVGRVLPGGSPAYFAVWLLPIAVLLAFDLPRRRVHPALLAGLPVFALMACKVALLSGSATAVAIGSALLRPFI